MRTINLEHFVKTSQTTFPELESKNDLGVKMS